MSPQAKKASAAGSTRNSTVGYTGRQGVGKIFYFLDQLRLEAMDAERTIKNLQTDLRLLVRRYEQGLNQPRPFNVV
jgi:hypothetical protein